MYTPLEKKVLYVGIDETNHGRNNEIVVLVSSFNPEDNVKRFNKKLRLNKELPEIKALINQISPEYQRNYSFVIVSEQMREIFKEDLFSEIVSCLFSKTDFEKVHSLNIYLDGEVQPDKIQRIKNKVSFDHNFDKDLIHVHAQSHSDKIKNKQHESLGFNQGKKNEIKYQPKIVHYADTIAFYLFRNSSLEDLENNLHRCNLRVLSRDDRKTKIIKMKSEYRLTQYKI